MPMLLGLQSRLDAHSPSGARPALNSYHPFRQRRFEVDLAHQHVLMEMSAAGSKKGLSQGPRTSERSKWVAGVLSSGSMRSYRRRREVFVVVEILPHSSVGCSAIVADVTGFLAPASQEEEDDNAGNHYCETAEGCSDDCPRG